MQFDAESITGFRKIITDELAYGVFLNEQAIRQEIEKHISTLLFHSPESMKQTTLKLLWHFIEKSKAKSIIGFTESDPSHTTVASWVAYQNEMPFYSYNLQDEGAWSQFVEPANCPCSLIIPYSTNDIQVNEIIDLYAKQQIPIIQLISLIEEHPIQTDFASKGVEYVKITDWGSIKNRIKQFRNLTDKKMTSILSIFQ